MTKYINTILWKYSNDILQYCLLFSILWLLLMYNDSIINIINVYNDCLFYSTILNDISNVINAIYKCLLMTVILPTNVYSLNTSNDIQVNILM